MGATIHDYDRRIRGYARLVEDSGGVTPKSKKLIYGFVESCVRDGLSKARQAKYLELMKLIAEKIGKDLDRVEKGDLERFVGELEGTDYSEWTKQSYKVALRRFYRWLYGLPKGKYPELVDWIATTGKKGGKLPEDLLTEEEVKRIMAATPHTRDKAFVALLWDAGLRIGEAGTLRVKDVVFDNYGAVIIVRGKTGSRRIRIVWSVSYLTNWLGEHPLRDKPGAPLWVKVWDGRYEAMNYYGLRKQLATAVRKAGIRKSIHPHIFRHSRATYMAKHLTEAQMNAYFGWVQGSDMPSVYVHLSGRDVDDAILRMHGLKSEEDEKSGTIMKICPRCRLPNPDGEEVCRRCTMVLDEKKACEIEEARSRLEKATAIGMKEGLINLLGASDLRKLLTREDVREIMREVLTEELKGEAKRLLKQGAIKI